jgi:pilus assembly protein Flp/PilA
MRRTENSRIQPFRDHFLTIWSPRTVRLVDAGYAAIAGCFMSRTDRSDIASSLGGNFMFDPIIRLILMTTFKAQDSAKRIRTEEGATAVEYGLLVSLIAGAIIIAVTLLGNNLSTLFNTMAGKL